ETSVTSGLLETAGFTAIEFHEVNEPVFYGPDPETALVTIQTFENVKNALDRPAKTAEIRARLLDMLEEHRTPHGIQFDSRAWLITGRRYGDSPLRAK
ncbi:methyltransferase, partial [Rhizobium ruizarguesonis]